MKKKIKKTKKKDNDLIRNYLEVNRSVLEGEKRISYLSFLKKYEGKGLYALYSADKLYYIGKASSLKSRIDQHLSDQHQELWDRFAMYMFSESTKPETIHHLESFLLRIAKPPGNVKSGKLPGSLQKELESFLLHDAKNEIRSLIHGVMEVEEQEGEESIRLTAKKLKAYLKHTGSQSKLANAIGISQPYTNILIKKDPDSLKDLRQFIIDKGLKDKVLELLESE